MNARTIATVFVCLAVVFAGCAGMNDGTGGDSGGDGAAGDTTTAPSAATTTSGAGGTTTQSTATTATATDEATTAVGSSTAAGTTTMAPETTAAPTATSTATAQAQPTATTTTASPATSDGGATTTDAPTESGGGDSASVSNPYTEGEYYQITTQITVPGTITTESILEFHVLSVDGEQVTVKFTNLKSDESITVQADRSQVFTTLKNKGFPKSVWFATLRGPAWAVQDHSMAVGSEWTVNSTTFTVTGTDTVAGVSCKTIKFVLKIDGEQQVVTACVNEDVTFALRYVVHTPGGSTTITVKEYRSGEDG